MNTSTPSINDQLKPIRDLLQAHRKEEARAVAVAIETQYVRDLAFVLIERSRPLPQ